MIKDFSYVMPVRIEYGNGVVKNVGKEIIALGCKKPFIVTDKGVVDAGLLHFVTDSLDDAGLEYEVFDSVIGTDIEIGEKVCAYVHRLIQDIGIPRFRDVKGVKEEDLPLYAELSFKEPNTTINPRVPTKEDYLEILKKAW